MHDMTGLKEMLEKELGKLSMENLSVSSLDTIHKLTDTIKNICKIEMLSEGGHSERYSRDGSYADGSYDGGSSYARHRDRMGRFTSRDYSGARRYSRDEAKDSMIEQIEDLMREATSERERKALMICKNALNEA